MSRYDRHLPKYQTEDAVGSIVGLVLVVLVLQAITGIDIIGWLF